MAAPIDRFRPVTPSLSFTVPEEEINAMLRSVPAELVQEISKRITEKQMACLHPIAAAHALWLASNVFPHDPPLKIQAEIAMRGVNRYIRQGAPELFSVEEREKLFAFLFATQCQRIAAGLACPDRFREAGTTFVMKAPTKFLLQKDDVGADCSFLIGNYPQNYTTSLRIELEQTVQQGQLVFSLVEKVNEVEIGQKVFTELSLQAEQMGTASPSGDFYFESFIQQCQELEQYGTP